MKIYKKDIENYLNSFSWDFREIFLEKSKTFKFWALNWVFKTPWISTLDGFSVLSRDSWKEYFQVFVWNTSDIWEKISSFKSDYSLNNKIDLVNLSGEEYFDLKELNEINFDIEEIVKNTEKILKNLPENKKEIIKASEIWINFSHKSFVVWNTLWNFWSDTLFYNTFFHKINLRKRLIFRRSLWKNFLNWY